MTPRTALRVIDENTSMPLKVVVPVMVALVGLVWWLSTQFGGLNDRISRLEWKVDQMGARVSIQQSEPQYAEGRP